MPGKHATSLDDGWVLAVEPACSIQAPEIGDLADQLIRAEQAAESAMVAEAVPEAVEPEESATVVVELPTAAVPVRRDRVLPVSSRSVERLTHRRKQTAFLGAAVGAAALLLGAFTLQSTDTAATTQATTGVGAGVAGHGPAIAGVRSSQAEPAPRATESTMAPVAVAEAPVAEAPVAEDPVEVAEAPVAPDVVPAPAADSTVEAAAPAEPVIDFSERMERALGARESGRLSVALTQVNAALRLRPRSAIALDLSADILLQMGQLPRAKAAAIKATRAGGHIDAWFTRGLIHYREGDLDQARTSLERYVELGGRSTVATSLLELIRHRQPEPADAAAAPTTPEPDPLPAQQ